MAQATRERADGTGRYHPGGTLDRLLYRLGFLLGGRRACPYCGGRRRGGGLMPSVYDSAIGQIKSLREVPRWSGSASSSVIPDSVRDDAVLFLRKIEARMGNSVLPPTLVTWTSDCGVSLEWKVDDPPELHEVVFLPKGETEYSVRNLRTDTLVRADEAMNIEDVLSWFKSGMVNRRSLIRS